MGTYATATTNVQPRVAGRTLGTGSTPTLAQVDTWVDEGEALVTGALQAAQIALPTAGSTGGKILTAWICDYPEAHCRMAWVAAIGGGGEDGAELLERFYSRLDDIANNPGRYAAMLNGGDAADANSRVRSHVINNYESKTVEDGDFEPVFTMDTDQEF